MDKNEKKDKRIEFPTAFTVLFIILIIAAILTFIVPAGMYSKLSYDADEGLFIVKDYNNEVSTFPATQESLDELNINMSVNKFLDGSVRKPIAIPGTYERIEQSPQGLFPIIMSPIQGVMDTVDIMIFVLILGYVLKGTFESPKFILKISYHCKTCHFEFDYK